MLRNLFTFPLVLIVLFLNWGAAQAQTALPTGGGGGAETSAAPALPEPLTAEAVREMVARMSDDQVREMLLQRLDAVAKAEQQTEPAADTLIETIQGISERFGEDLVDAVSKVPLLVSGQAQALSNFGQTYGASGLAVLFGLIVAALAAGLALEFLVTLATRRWQGEEVEHVEGEDDLWKALSFLSRRLARELLGLVGFYIGVRTVGVTLLNEQQLQFAAPFVTYLVWLPRLGAAISRFVLAPNRDDLRLVNVSDHWAKYLHRNLIGLFLLGGFTVFIVRFNLDNGVAMGDTRIGFWLNTAMHIYIAVIAWTAREGLSDMMRGTDPDRTQFDEWVARAYPYFGVIVAVSMWFVVEIVAGYGQVELLAHAPHYTTMFWLLMAPALDTAIRGLVQHLLPPMIGEGPVAEKAYKSTKRGYIKIGRVIAIIFVVLMIANAWEIDIVNLAAAGVGERFAANVIEFLLTVAVGYIVYEGVSLYINRQLAKEQTSIASTEEEVAEGEGGAGGSRLSTVLPLALVTAQVAIVVIFGLLAISALGVNIAPLLAGAGILGLAIGFGAQKLVADVVSGVFFLIDDAFRVGEYVEVGGTRGTVEKISIRSMQLRHHRGPVHTIPYGEIPQLTNYSRDWVIMKLKFTVPFDTDPNKVKKIFKKIGAEMMEDPLYKDSFLQPFKSQGVFDFDDVGMVIRGKFMAKPGQQFTIRKEIYNRVKKEFDAAGIPFARREVRVAIPGMEDHEHMTDTEKAAVAAAAGEAVQQQIEQAEAHKKE